MLISNVVGARPNFMKIAPVVMELSRRKIPHRLIHTGQHYDEAMSKVFFDELGMPEPEAHLGVGSGSHAQQTARVMVAIEEDFLKHRPDMVVVAGDVNSTAAAAMTAAKLGIPVAHVEAGLRSFDRSMPEELNRIVTDHLSDLLLTTEESANQNLKREGITDSKICFAGNCMVDSLLRFRDRAIEKRPWEAHGLSPSHYALLTLHRPSNVDDPFRLTQLMDFAARISYRVPVLFPAHPRTSERMESLGVKLPERVIVARPQSYVTFLGLMARAQVVLTDSGGIQEETTALSVPCLTLRGSTERPSTIEQGTNCLVGEDLDLAEDLVERITLGDWKRGSVPPRWDGCAAQRVVSAIETFSPRASASGVH